MTEANEKPELRLFQTTPLDLLARPPLASSLQSFESCLFLIGLDRFPHGFLACVIAIESAIKAHFRIPAQGGPKGSTDLVHLLDRVRNDYANLGAFPAESIKTMRATRNQIVHHGFSPKDDRLTALLLLESAVPFLAAVYRELFQFELYDGLHEEFGSQVRNALKAFEALAAKPDADPARCFLVLRQLVRWSAKESFMSSWESEAGQNADAKGLKFQIVENKRNKVQRLLDPSWAFNCPVCGGFETFVRQLVEDDLDQRRVALSRAYCLECDLMIPENTPALVDAICQPQIEAKREVILRDFGIS